MRRSWLKFRWDLRTRVCSLGVRLERRGRRVSVGIDWKWADFRVLRREGKDGALEGVLEVVRGCALILKLGLEGKGCLREWEEAVTGSRE